MTEKPIDKLKEKIKKLNSERDKNKIIPLLQEINNLFLNNYKFTIGGLEIEPIETEIYYHKGSADDDGIDKMIYKHDLQKEHYRKPFFHRTSTDDINISRGGLDICLSDSDDYYLSILIRTAKIGDQIISGINKIQQLFYYQELETINQKLKALENAEITFEENTCKSKIVTQPRIKGNKYEENGEELNSIKLEDLDKFKHHFYTKTKKETLKKKL